MKNTTQDLVFNQGEADAWFQRNQNLLQKWKPENDLPLRILKLYNLKPKRVLEVGASSGFRIAHLADIFASEAIAVDPSQDAIKYGQSVFPKVTFFQGVASSIPVTGCFDLVIVNYVLHWIDRSSLLASMKELDRVVKDGGFLIIGDFFPTTPCKTPYHHLPEKGMFTYKQDYARILTESGLYHLVGLLTDKHGETDLNAFAKSDDRYYACLLRKDITQHCQVTSIPHPPSNC